MTAIRKALFGTWLLLLAAAAAAQDVNITQSVPALEKLLAAEPLVIADAQISRPKAEGDITLRADVSFGGAPPLRVKLRRAEPGADSFNNVPRYELAAYELQKLFVDPPEYVVPPTALRMVPLADFTKYAPAADPTFKGADQVLAVVQYWLNDIKVIADVYDPQRFAADPVYARHIGQLNILTYLVEHRDSNVGNFLIGRSERGARVFSIDHGVAFASPPSDRGELWKDIRVDRMPADAIERLRALTPEVMQQKLGVLAQWKLDNGKFVPVALGANLGDRRGVRREGDVVQMGLKRSEISELYRNVEALLKLVDRGKIMPVARPDS